MKPAEIWRSWGFPAASAAALAVGLTICFQMFARGAAAAGPMAIDFTHIWTAGKVWADGHTPYGPAFSEAGGAFQSYNSAPFVYPPNWHALSRALAFLDPASANSVWFVLCQFMLALSCWLLAKSFLHFRFHMMPWARALIPARPTAAGAAVIACAIAALIAVSKAAQVSAYLGQVSMLIFLGQSCLIFGVVRSNRPMTTLGLVLLLLKPQLGLPYAAALAFDRKQWPQVAAAAAASLALAAPAFLSQSPMDMAHDFSANLKTYGERAENAITAMSGIGNLLYRATGAGPSILIWVSAASALGVAGGFLLKRALPKLDPSLAMLLAATLSLFVVAPLRDWDFSLFVPLVLCLPFLRGASLVVGIIGVLPFTRLTRVLELGIPGGSWAEHQSVSTTAMAVGALLCLAALFVEIWRRNQPSGLQPA